MDEIPQIHHKNTWYNICLIQSESSLYICFIYIHHGIAHGVNFDHRQNCIIPAISKIVYSWSEL